MRTHNLKTSIALLVAATALASACSARPNTADAASVSRLERHQEFDEDIELVQRYDDGLADTLAYARNNPQLLPADAELVDMRDADKKELREVYGAVLDRIRALDQIKTFWRGAYRINPVTDRKAHARSFLAGFAAWAVQYHRGLQWVEMTVPNKALETILDEAAPAQDIPAGSFAEFKYQVIHVKEVSRLYAGYKYYETQQDELRDSNCHNEAACRRAMELVEWHVGGAKEQLERRGLVDFSYNAWDIARDTGFKAWFPVQAKVASWMGDTRVRRKHTHLISREQIAQMRRELEPGDMVVTRSNWYVSNVGLPGFWPHSELYVGSPEELEEYFADPKVRAHFREHTGHDGLVAYLKAEHPKTWRAYELRDSDGKPHRIIEARSEGVVFNSLYQAAGADYAAAMRPNASKVDKAEAIAEAFAHWGKPYDFNFDFLTDRKLVCTELLYKAWQPTERKDGVEFELSSVMGRTTLPANELVRQFDEHYDSNQRSLEFVYFLDGRESTGSAVVGDLAAFRNSWKRPKWDFAQK